MLGRFAIGATVVIAFTAATTAVAGLLQFKQLAKDISVLPPIKQARITIADPGNPQTILIIGSDHRAGEPFRSANTDTMMLVRIDPSSATINVLSVPRDLKVDIPGAGVAKLNSAYSVGGPNLLIKVLQHDVFPDLKVNHIVDVNFRGFRALVDAIGCVYTDVDHRYYNNTAYTNYSSIDLQPGYQKLCGTDALTFVRFRHTDNDIVRNARQQDFIRWAKDQYPQGRLIANRDMLLRIFGAHAQTDHDLHTVDGLINLFNLVAFADGHTIKQVHFPAVLLPCGGGGGFGGFGAGGVAPCYVTADPAAEQQAFGQFMKPTHQTATPPSPAARPASAGTGPAKTSDLTAALTDGKTQAAALHHPGLPVLVPGQIATGSQYCSDGTCTQGPVHDSYPRAYAIGGHPAYRLTLAIIPSLGQYYGIQGTTWQNLPITAHPTKTQTVGGKRLLLFIDGGKLSLVAWRTPRGIYWVSNTLADDLSTPQMIGIASSLTRVR
jgi:LCP family protein required for cell wall assembly